MTNKAMLNPIAREQLARKLSHDGKYCVVFGNYPEYPDVFEFITPPSGDGTRIRYINMDARPGAKISMLTR